MFSEDIDRALEMEEYPSDVCRDTDDVIQKASDPDELLSLKIALLMPGQQKSRIEQPCYRDTTLREVLDSLEKVFRVSELDEPTFSKARSADGDARRFLALWKDGKENLDETLTNLGFFKDGYDTLGINDNGPNG